MSDDSLTKQYFNLLTRYEKLQSVVIIYLEDVYGYFIDGRSNEWIVKSPDRQHEMQFVSCEQAIEWILAQMTVAVINWGELIIDGDVSKANE